jgi:hypothetical protein
MQRNCKKKDRTPISKEIFAHLKDPLRHDLDLVLLLFFLHKNGTFDAISQTSVSPPKLET